MQILWQTVAFIFPLILFGMMVSILISSCRASDRLQKNKVKVRRIFGDKSAEKLADLAGISWEFRGNLCQKAIGKKLPILWLFLRQFCADQTSIFNIFLTEVIICSSNNNTLQKWTNGKAFNIMASAQFFAT